jgi:hypothetical protein
MSDRNMQMTFAIAVEDSFPLPDRGVVVSGVNLLFDREASETIKALIGDRVRLHRAGEDDRLGSVLDVAVSESLIGRTNISVLVADAELRTIARGVAAYAIRAAREPEEC